MDNKGVSVSTFKDLTELTLGILLQCAFNSNTSCQQVVINDKPYVEAVNTHNYTRLTKILFMSDFIYYSSAEGKHFKRVCEAVHKQTDFMINERKQTLGIGSSMKKGGERTLEQATN